jgi:hypothetical protein
MFYNTGLSFWTATAADSVSTSKALLDEFKVGREILIRRESEKFLGSNMSLNQDEQFA